MAPAHAQRSPVDGRSALVTGAASGIGLAIHGIEPSAVVSDVLLEANAVKRLIEPDEVAEAVLSLCREAAWTMTGSVLMLDAGWLAH